MIIQHNMSAVFTNRQLGRSTSNKAKASEKLGSGYRINRAADDAAGLSISEKMRGQIRGLEQAEENLQDGISLLHTADGAMEEIHSILQRIRELGVQAANDTNEFADRKSIQEEINQLTDNIDDITDNTEFNEIKILKGGYLQVKAEETKEGELPSWFGIPSQLTMGDLTIPGNSAPAKHSYASIDFSGVDAANINELIGKGFYSTCCTCTEKYSIRFLDTEVASSGSPNPIININISGISAPEELVDKILAQGSPYMNHYTSLMKEPSDAKKLILYDWRENQASDAANGYGVVGSGYIKTTVTKTGDTALNIQAGANSNQKIGIELPQTDTLQLGVRGINVLNSESAGHSISFAENAIRNISRERSRLGAIGNQMEAAASNVGTTAENLTASESRIRDLDMAKEMVELSKSSILQQVGQSMMTQSVQNTEGVLMLLR